MTNLLERCRTAGLDEAATILDKAFSEVCPVPGGWGGGGKDFAEWSNKISTFNKLIAINTEPAFIGAALMLVPEGWEYDMSTVYGVARASININHGPDDGPHYGSNACGCLSLAILAAVLAAGDVK